MPGPMTEIRVGFWLTDIETEADFTRWITIFMAVAGMISSAVIERRWILEIDWTITDDLI